jgi:hypothetical protein
MALKFHSLFYYGHKVDENNNLIDFADSPGGPEKTAELPVGSYTFTKFLEVVTNALNAASSLEWDFSIDRTTRIVTLTSSGAADLLFGTGTNFLNSPAAILGFAQADILNDTSFVGVSPSGSSWSPQFPLQDYKPKTVNKKLVNAVVTKSATGDNVSVQSFGIDRLIKCNAKYITNNPTDGLLRNNPSAVEEAIAFMDYAVEKNPIEFMENENEPDVFDKIYLESSPSGSDGTSYELSEYYDKGLPEYFETGLLTFKVINRE